MNRCDVNRVFVFNCLPPMQESMSHGPLEASNLTTPCIEGRHFQAALQRVKPSVNPKVRLPFLTAFVMK